MKKTNLSWVGALLVFALLLWCTAATPGKIADPSTYTCAVYSSALSLLPPVVAIVLALNTKEVYTSLLVGIATGALLYANGNLELALTTLFFNEDGGMISKLSDSSNVGKVEFIIDYQPKVRQNLFWQWCKTIFVCVICFCGAAFAIMTFNNDVSVTDAFDQIYLLVTGTSSDGFTILEISYSIGLGLGIVVFFNHFAHWKITTDPTPLEVEMRLYEENVCKTLIQNAGRKESGVDVS